MSIAWLIHWLVDSTVDSFLEWGASSDCLRLSSNPIRIINSSVITYGYTRTYFVHFRTVYLYQPAVHTALLLLLEAAMRGAVAFLHALVYAQSAEVGFHSAEVRGGSPRRVRHLVVRVICLRDYETHKHNSKMLRECVGLQVNVKHLQINMIDDEN